ncbi:MAG: hypothetical protein ABH821_05425 [archaeon]
MFRLTFDKDWDKYFLKLDKQAQKRIWKKIQQLKTLQKIRHLGHGLPYFVVETGQYRICFKEKRQTRTIMFAGTHKQYEKWYK